MFGTKVKSCVTQEKNSPQILNIKSNGFKPIICVKKKKKKAFKATKSGLIVSSLDSLYKIIGSNHSTPDLLKKKRL